MNMFLYAFSIALAIGFYLFLKIRKTKKYTEFSRGFSNFMDVHLKESDLLQILVLEELNHCKSMGRVPVAKETRGNRIVFFCVYLLSNACLLALAYYKFSTLILCTVLTLLYIYLYDRFDPVREICDAVKMKCNVDISKIVFEMTTEEPRKSLKPFGIAALVLSLVLVFAVRGDIQYDFILTDEGYRVEKCYPGIFQQEIQVPETYNGEPVVQIGAHAFENIFYVSQITLPDSITQIDSYAFKGCLGLKQIRLPAYLETLNGESFKNCISLFEIVIPEGVTEIRGNTFENCRSLELVKLHEGITEIHAYAFRNCKNLKQINLPSQITEIHAYTFEGCVSLREIDIPEGVTRIAAHAFYGCISLQHVSVPESLLEIGSSAFRKCESLTEITLPESVNVNARALKDSPTKIFWKTFTNAQEQQIQQEIREKKMGTLYYISLSEDPDALFTWKSDGILIVDHEACLSWLRDDMVLQPLKDASEVQAYLERAREEGVTKVVYRIDSPLGSEISGEHYCVEETMSIENMLDLYQKKAAEEVQ